MKTFQPKKETIERTWHLVDAKDQVLGRLASTVARQIQGKGKRTYSAHIDSGDHVVVVNADKIRITGDSKPVQKVDFRHSGYPGGTTITPYVDFLQTKPERAVYLAVSGMLPKTRLRPRQLKRLKIYRGDSHPHSAQFASRKPATKKES